MKTTLSRTLVLIAALTLVVGGASTVEAQRKGPSRGFSGSGMAQPRATSGRFTAKPSFQRAPTRTAPTKTKLGSPTGSLHKLGGTTPKLSFPKSAGNGSAFKGKGGATFGSSPKLQFGKKPALATQPPKLNFGGGQPKLTPPLVRPPQSKFPGFAPKLPPITKPMPPLKPGLKPLLPGKPQLPPGKPVFPPIVKPPVIKPGIMPPIVRPPVVRPRPLPPIVRPNPPICYPKPNWCQRPTWCHWWWNACDRIRYIQPAHCVTYVGTYVTCPIELSSGVVVDVRWWLGVKGLELPNTGLGIEAIEANSPAERAGLAPGMIIVECNGIKIVDSAAMATAIEQSGGVLNLTVLQKLEGEAAQVTIQMQRLTASSF